MTARTRGADRWRADDMLRIEQDDGAVQVFDVRQESLQLPFDDSNFADHFGAAAK